MGKIVMNRKERMEILEKYRQADGTIHLPIGLMLNKWQKINGFERGETLKDVIDDIVEEIQESKEDEE